MREKMSRRSAIQPIMRALRDARVAKKLSQRALSERSGLPQAQISRIESGEVDPQLTTLVELARALDLDVLLAPTGASMAVAAVVEESAERTDERYVRALLQDLATLGRRLTPRLHARHGGMLEHSVADLLELAPLIRGPAFLDVLEQARRKLAASATGHATLSPSAQRGVEAVTQSLLDLRDTLAHVRGFGESRPAYRLDDEDEGELS